jgi:hypothetical protein
VLVNHVAAFVAATVLGIFYTHLRRGSATPRFYSMRRKTDGQR